MIKLLIVEDEPLTLEMLEKLYQWEELDYQVVQTAQTAADALAGFQKHHPQVVMTDVRLPDMTGLEMLAQMRNMPGGDTAHFLVLSAYGDFSFAQEAIRMQIDSYILKPVNKEELKRELLKTASAFRRTETATYRNLGTLLWDAAYGSLQQRESTFEIISPDLLNHPYQIGCIQFSYNGQAQHISHQLTDRVLGEVIPDKLCVYSIHRRKMLLLVPQETDIRACAERIADAMRRQKENPDIRCVLGLAAASRGRDGLFASVQQAYTAMQKGFYDLAETVFREDETTSMSETMDETICDVLEIALPYALRDRLDLAGDRIIKHIDSCIMHRMLPHRLQENAYVLLSSLAVDNVQEFLPSQEQFMYVTDAQSLQNSVCKYVEILKQKGKRQPLDYDKLFICQVNRYIQENYQRPGLSLCQIAEALDMSRTYLSSRYHEISGVKLWDFVTDLRVEKAKILLGETQDIIYSIAQQCGFSNEFHFARTFKKICGITCTQYRQRHKRLE